MKNILRKRYIFLFAVIIFLLLLFLYILNINAGLNNLEIYFLDVGQGDSILIRTPSNKYVLIDGGPDNLVLRRLGEILPFYLRKIDYVIFSHYHDDHITGLIEIFRRYRVNNFIYATSDYASPILTTLLDYVDSSSIVKNIVKNEVKLIFSSSCYMNLINTQILGVKKDQNNSLVAQLNCNGKKFLFSGDNSSDVEKALLDIGLDLRVDIFKASHHGSKTANSKVFLEALKAKLIVISVGIDNKFGHPSQEILELARTLGIRVERTDKKGTIKIFIPPP